MRARETLRQKRGSTDVDRHVRVELVGAEFTKSIPGEARGIVDEQADRAIAAAKMISAQSGSARSATTFIAPSRHLIVGMMDVRDDVPAVAEQRFGEVSADAFAGAGDDGGASVAMDRPLRRFRRNDNRAAMPETRPPIDLKGVSLAELQKLIDERRCRRSINGIPSAAAIPGCGSRATGLVS